MIRTGIAIAVMAAVVLLGGCQEKPPLAACSDYRWMTFTEDGPLGWTDIKTRLVCVIREQPQ